MPDACTSQQHGSHLRSWGDGKGPTTTGTAAPLKLVQKVIFTHN